MKFQIISGILAAGVFTTLSAQEFPVLKEGHPEITLRVQSFAREQAVVHNTIRWSQFTFLVPEGAVVREGDVLFELDMSVVEHRARTLANRIEEAESQIRQGVGRIERQILALEDQQASLEDQLRVQEARLNYLRGLPEPETVALAEGRLAVAGEQLRALQRERDTAARRVEQRLLAPFALEQAETAVALQEARTDYARERLATARLPAHPSDLRIVELRMDNLRLEIEKVKQEVLSQREFLRIEEESARRQRDEIDRERLIVEEELQQGILRAPRDGVVVYTPRLKRELATGGKPARGMPLAEIPDPESFALLGRLPEEQRFAFRPGDPVTVRMNVHPERELTGRVHSISALPRDVAETDRRTQGDASAATGVKVLDVVMVLDEAPRDIPFGTFGSATIRTAEPLRGPAVPLEWVRLRDGKPHLSLNGVFRETDGTVVGPWFFLTGAPESGVRMAEDGRWPERGDSPEDVLELAGDRFAASGQLTPLESVEVTVPSVRAWDIRVTRLFPEDEVASKGDVLAVLDSENVTQRATRAADQLIRRTGDRESAEERFRQRERDSAFQVARARNQLEIRRLETELLETGLSASQVQQARLDLRVAEIQYQAAAREMARREQNPELLAPAEWRRRERDLQRRELQLEQARLQWQTVNRGADPVARSQSRLELARQEANLSELEARTARDLRGAMAQVQRRSRQERNAELEVRRSQEALEAMQVRAPADGLVKYENLWDGVGVSKLRQGMSVWGGTHIMSLSDSNRMIVRVSVPERHLRHLHTGMSVDVRIPSEGRRVWRGEVQRIHEILLPVERSGAVAGMFRNQEPAFEQQVHLEVLLAEDGQVPMKPGVIAHVVFPFPRGL